MSYIGANLFEKRITDIPVNNGQRFPQSHGAYWSNPVLGCHRGELEVNPWEIHAFIVGIEKYDIDDSWNLNDPAVDAAKFVRWLRARHVPPGNIGLFASSLDVRNQKELDAFDLLYKPADHKTIMDSLMGDFANWRGELLLVYWGGHGVIGEDARRTNAR